MKIKIDIFSGFLGAGKTKLIKKLINENFYTEKVIVVENEFGEVSIDDKFLQKCDVKVKEINAGCICCSILNDFNNALQEIISSQEAKRIIIEPSGVGKLSEIVKIVKKLEANNEVLLNMIITVVDITMYEDFIDFFSEFYKDQIIYANTIVLSRTQNVDYKKLQSVVSKIRELNKRANIITTPWDDLTGDSIVKVGEKDGEKDLFRKVNIIKRPKVETKFKTIRKNSAPNIFSSWGIETPKLFSVETLKYIFSNFKNEQLYGKVLRAKGIVQTDRNHWVEFDFVPNEFEIRDTEPDYTGQVCVIGVNLNKENLISLF